jgi:NDP-sugar pyrophosphorylase family protein
MNDKLNIFILAAGLGERLRPITDYIPKPLVPVLGIPAIQHVLNNVSVLPFHKIGINIHYKMEAVEKWFFHCSLKQEITLFPEKSIMGTGGALKNAEEFLKEGTFLVHNSDILTDINLEQLLEYHKSSNNIATLAVHNYPKYNCLLTDENAFLVGMKKDHSEEEVPLKAFTGIAIYEPEFLACLPAGESSVVDTWFKAISAGHKIGVLDVCRGGFQTRPCWNDIGTPSAYALAVFDKLKAEGETIYIHPSTEGCRDIELQGSVVIEEGCKFGKGLALKNCIALPGSNAGTIHELPLHENCIIGPDFKIELNESEILPFKDEGRQLIGTGGSDRKYYRVRENNESAVLMQCNSNDPEFPRHIEYSRFFLKNSVPVPQLMRVSAEKMQALFEDAGDTSLYSYLKCARGKAEVRHIYEKVIDALIQIHTKASENVLECTLLQERLFDYEYFRWETDYFIERFVRGIKNIKIDNDPELKKEFHDLASKADSFPKTIIHRDFQSQNIMVMKGQEIRIIDYQGARIGPPAYDVASILLDPYYRLEDDMREHLLEYYMNKMKISIGAMIDETSLKDSLLTCSLQRHMQALGAYGFLSSVKGKKYFLKFVPEGLRLLKEDASHAKDEYPGLYQLIMSLE